MCVGSERADKAALEDGWSGVEPLRGTVSLEGLVEMSRMKR